MECSEPGAIRDEELVAYLAGERVRPAVVQHLAHCHRCSSQLATYRRMDLQLLSKLYRWDCPPNQLLGEYQMGLLDAEQVLAVKNHLRMCMLCAAEVASVAQFLANDPMLAEPVSATPEAVLPAVRNNHRSAQNARRTLQQLRERSLSGTRRIAAMLLPPQPRLAYQRAAQTSMWPRNYAAEDVNISVQVERSPNRKDGLQLIGFVTREGTPLEALQGTPVQLSAPSGPGEATFIQNIDELGNFVFPSLSPATYILELHLPEGVVVIEPLPITLSE
jgi:anti-sigma factor RsiW